MSINVIGVTGPSGAGKSSLCEYAEKNNVKYINADEVYHSMLTPDTECTAALAREFGEGILSTDGSPDRKKLGEIVFSSDDALKRLNGLVLGFVITEIKKIIALYEENGEKNVIVDAPTLIESGFDRECDAVVSVLAPKHSRIERIQKRDSITYESAQTRVNAQKSDEFYIDNSDFILVNEGDRAQFEEQVGQLLDVILKN